MVSQATPMLGFARSPPEAAGLWTRVPTKKHLDSVEYAG